MIPGTNRYQDRWKWFLLASRSSLNPPGHPGKAKNLRFRTRKFTEKFANKSFCSYLTPLLGGPPQGDGPGPQSRGTPSLTGTAVTKCLCTSVMLGIQVRERARVRATLTTRSPVRSISPFFCVCVCVCVFLCWSS